MTAQKLAFDGGTPVRASPMPPRIGFGPEEEKELMECIAHYRNLDSDPPYIGLWNKRFSEAFAEYQGGGFSLPVSSGTGAIYVSLASLGLPKGSTVLTSPVTCSGVLGSIQALGFVPKVVDSAPSSFNVDAEQVKARISKDVRCLLVTHAAGEPVDVPAIRDAIKAVGLSTQKILRLFARHSVTLTVVNQFGDRRRTHIYSNYRQVGE